LSCVEVGVDALACVVRRSMQARSSSAPEKARGASLSGVRAVPVSLPPLAVTVRWSSISRSVRRVAAENPRDDP